MFVGSGVELSGWRFGVGLALGFGHVQQVSWHRTGSRAEHRRRSPTMHPALLNPPLRWWCTAMAPRCGAPRAPAPSTNGSRRWVWTTRPR